MEQYEAEIIKESDELVRRFLLTIGAFALLLLAYPEDGSSVVESLTTNIGIWATAIIAIIGLGYYVNWIIEDSSVVFLLLLCLPGAIFFSPIIGIYALFKHRKIIIAGGKCLIQNLLKA